MRLFINSPRDCGTYSDAQGSTLHGGDARAVIGFWKKSNAILAADNKLKNAIGEIMWSMC